MDWQRAIDRQRTALASIIAALFAMAGLAEGGSVARLPLPVYRAVLRILYPAESAVRRLIFAVARGLVIKPLVKRTVPASLRVLAREGARRMAFQLCDVRSSPRADETVAPPSRLTGARMHAFVAGGWLSIGGRPAVERVAGVEGTADATRLCRRLAAIKSALENLPREARRMARWRARAAARPPEKFRKPVRPGRPPGHVRESRHEVDEVLKDCHWLAWEAAKLDTS